MWYEERAVLVETQARTGGNFFISKALDIAGDLHRALGLVHPLHASMQLWGIGHPIDHPATSTYRNPGSVVLVIRLNPRTAS